MVRKLSHNLPKPKIDFIWAVREPGKRALGLCLYNFGCLPRHRDTDQERCCVCRRR
jgi:hypothetical protein